MNTRILLVDDDQDFLEAFELYLTRHGFSILSTQEPKRARDLAAEFRPHIVVVDLNMGDVDGAELLEEFYMDTEDRVLAVVSANIDTDTYRSLHNTAAIFCCKSKLTDPQFIAELRKYACFRFPELETQLAEAN